MENYNESHSVRSVHSLSIPPKVLFFVRLPFSLFLFIEICMQWTKITWSFYNDNLLSTYSFMNVLLFVMVSLVYILIIIVLWSFI